MLKKSNIKFSVVRRIAMLLTRSILVREKCFTYQTRLKFAKELNGAISFKIGYIFGEIKSVSGKMYLLYSEHRIPNQFSKNWVKSLKLCSFDLFTAIFQLYLGLNAQKVQFQIFNCSKNCNALKSVNFGHRKMFQISNPLEIRRGIEWCT